MKETVIILGGGISGLVAAHRLLVAAPGLDVLLLEGGSRLGGTLGTESVNGFLFERGPAGFLDNVPAAVDLARELGLGDRLLPASEAASRRSILRGGRLIPLPAGPLQLLRSPVLSLRGKLRLLAEPLQPRGPAEIEDSVASFGRRRLGEEATSVLLDPLVTGIYAGDVERVSLPSAFPRIAALEREHGSLVRGMLARRRERRLKGKPGASGGGPAGPGGRLHSFPRGLEELVEALALRLGSRVRTGAGVEAVRPRSPAAPGDGYDVILRDRTVLRAQALVCALPAPRAASLFSSSNPDLANALEEIPYAPVAVACLGLPRSSVSHPLDGLGFLIPRGEGLRSLGAIFVSTIFPPHAPEGTVSLRVLLGGARDPEAVGLGADEIMALVLREMGPVLGLRGQPLASRIHRYPQGIPQYNVGHSKRLRRLDGWLARLPGLYLAGNAYRGVGINDCVADGARVAGELLAFLGRPRAEKSAPRAAEF